MSYFRFNNISSTKFDIRIQSKNVYSSPKYDSSLISIPGRDGDLINPSGRFPNQTITYTCYVVASSIQELADKLTAIKNWLYEARSEYAWLEDSYDVKFKRKAVFNNKLDIADQARRIGVFTLSFSAEPFRYYLDGLDCLTILTSKTISNPFSFSAQPYIKAYGNGEGRIIINNKIWHISNIDEYLEIDSELMNCFKGTELKNRDVSGEGFPTLEKGDNAISIEGDIEKLEIIPRWRSL